MKTPRSQLTSIKSLSPTIFINLLCNIRNRNDVSDLEWTRHRAYMLMRQPGQRQNINVRTRYMT